MRIDSPIDENLSVDSTLKFARLHVNHRYQRIYIIHCRIVGADPDARADAVEDMGKCATQM